MFRLARFALPVVRATPAARQVARTFPRISVTVSRRFASGSPSETEMAHIKVQQLLSKIQEHPSIVEKLDQIGQIMIDKGLVPNADGFGGEQQLSPMQMFKVFMNKDIRQAMAELKEELHAAGIELGAEDLDPLMTVLGLKKE